MEFVYLILALAAALAAGYFIAKIKTGSVVQTEKEKFNQLEREHVLALSVEKEKFNLMDKDLSSAIARLETELLSQKEQIVKKQSEIDSLIEQNTAKDKNLQEFIKKEAELTAQNQALTEKLNTLKEEIDGIGIKYAAEFKNLANEILEDKSKRFTEKNRENLESILKPLGENISLFRKTVEETYDKESKERFSLGEKVKELADLNKKMSEEAHNLTRALKGDTKTQGDWGEMILETILEKSGLRRNEEYFMQNELKDDDGKALRSDAEGKKMRPDAMIVYPDNRTVIIDSKVSLNAFTRYVEAEDSEIQKKELAAHVSAVKNHIISLSTKAYDDYDKALDFVMMFIPSEPAYIAVMQGEPDLWSFAYDKRILLMNPTNLITSLKLIVDLWKREYQNRNAQAIADRGALLYDKFVGFVDNLKDVGDKIDKAGVAYQNAYRQLSEGPGNLVNQASELKKLGVKNKKELSKKILGEE